MELFRWVMWILGCVLAALVFLSPELSLAQVPNQLPATSTSSAPPAPPPPKVVLVDQFNRTHSLAQHRGHVVVLVYGDKKGSKAARKIGEYLHVIFHPTAKGQPPAKAARAPVSPIPNWPNNVPVPDVRVIPVACIGKLPAVVRGFIQLSFRRAMSSVPVWLDFGTTMKRNFGLARGVPNIAVIDTQGAFRFTAGGNLRPEQFAELVNTIEDLRLEARPAGNLPVLMAPGGQ